MRLDFMRARRDWEASLAKDAPLLPSGPPEPDEDENAYKLPTFSSGKSMQISLPSTQLQVLKEEEEVDEMAQMEDRALEALLEMMPESHDGNDGKWSERGQEQNLWSDDDDYEELFSELMERDVAGTEWQASTERDGEAMDMS